MIEAFNRLIGGLWTLTVSIVSWVFFAAIALALIAAVIAIGAAIGPFWVICILLLLILLK